MKHAMSVVAAVIIVTMATAPTLAERPSFPAPSVDYHQHLFSPALARLISTELSPDVALPTDLAALLERRARAWNDPSTLRSIFSSDAETLTRDRRGWIRGGDAVSDYLGKLFTREFRFAPTQYLTHGKRADISGYYARGEGAARQTVGFFQISAVRETGGWRITREVPVFPIPQEQKPILAADLIAMLDAAGIGKAVVLSEAFWWDSPQLATGDVRAKVAEENDWTAAQVAQFPRRLTAFCSFNPVADHALAELERCAASKRFAGIKLSFAMSQVDIVKDDHRRKVQTIFAAANRHRLPVVVHLASGSGYGATHARLFVDEILSRAPDIDVQIAHLWGGEGFQQDALNVLVAAVRDKAQATRRLYFDVAEVWTAGSPERLEAVAAAIRAIGTDRIRYGSDAALNGRLTPADAWRRLRLDVPLSDEEYRRIAGWKAPATP